MTWQLGSYGSYGRHGSYGKLTASHLLGEEDDHLGEVDGSGGLGDHALGLTVGDGAADGGEGGLQVAGGQDAILVEEF